MPARAQRWSAPNCGRRADRAPLHLRQRHDADPEPMRHAEFPVRRRSPPDAPTATPRTRCRALRRWRGFRGDRVVWLASPMRITFVQRAPPKQPPAPSLTTPARECARGLTRRPIAPASRAACRKRAARPSLGSTTCTVVFADGDVATFSAARPSPGVGSTNTSPSCIASSKNIASARSSPAPISSHSYDAKRSGSARSASATARSKRGRPSARWAADRTTVIA